MLHTFNTIRTRGFTLIELLVVIAIIGLLSTIIAAPIQNARKKARDSKKIAEVKAVQLALDQYAEANAGQYPTSTARLAPTYIPILPAFASTSIATVADRDKFAYVPYLVGGTGVTDSGIFFGYHLGVKLENNSQALDSDRDCHGVDTASDFTLYNGGTSTCAFYSASDGWVAALYTNATVGPYDYSNFQTGMLPQVDISGMTDATTTAEAMDDFSGQDNNKDTCNSNRDCIFDVTGQQ